MRNLPMLMAPDRPRSRAPRGISAPRACGGAALRWLLVAAVVAAAAACGPKKSPVISVWNGTQRVVGERGIPQRWVNVVGNIHDPDGVASASYSLNGGPAQPLPLGPDGLRLVEQGDYNIEIPHTSLAPGTNTVEIVASDTLGHSATKQVTLERQVGNVWPLDYQIDWSQVSNPAEVLEVVDGAWFVVEEGVRTGVPGYDRLMVLGDLAWHSYEAVIPMTLNAHVPPGTGSGGSCGNVGFVMRWRGHVDWGSPEQPLEGWLPLGAFGGYDFCSDKTVLSSHGDWRVSGGPLELGTTYVFKVRVERTPTGTDYFLKVWPQGDPEPAEWTLEGQEGPADVQSGSLGLVAHHVDVTYGDVSISPVETDATPPVLSDVSVEPGETAARVAWTTDEPALSMLELGTTTAYELGTLYDHFPRTGHLLAPAGLEPGQTYHARITAVDAAGNAVQSGDFEFTASGGYVPPGVLSDDFGSDPLADGLWTLVDPVGDVLVSHDAGAGTVALELPAAVDHEDKDTPRLLQPADDTDLELEVAFQSSLGQRIQRQGIWVEEASGEYLVFELMGIGGGDTRVHAGNSGTNLFKGQDVFSSRVVEDVPSNTAWVRVLRQGDLWTVFTSTDGNVFTSAGSFYRPADVAAVGVHAGNQGIFGDSAPAHTAVIDSFRTDPDPSDVVLGVQVQGSGTVLRDPDQPAYAPGTLVELTAVPDPGFVFEGWGGDLAGGQNPVTVDVTTVQSVTATFVPDTSDETPPTLSDLSVAALGSDSATLTWTTDEPADSAVDFGTAPGDYTGSESQPELVSEHSVVLSGLLPETTYYFRARSADVVGNEGSSAELSFTTGTPPPPSPPVSDDFGGGVLDSALWTFVDPLADGSVSVNDTQLEISVPDSGLVHDVWTGSNDVPRLRQSVTDEDFEVEAKFDSELGGGAGFRSQGILVEQSDLDVVRVEFHNYLGTPKLFVASIFGGSASVQLDQAFAELPAPMWLRVARSGDTFTVSWSLDGQSFTPAVSFDQPMTVDGVSVYAGSDGSTAHTARVDYFLERSDPDAVFLDVQVQGGGTVTRTPDRLWYAPGDLVELAAAADPGFVFDAWGGDLSGDQNPVTVNVTNVQNVTAGFVPDPSDTIPPVISGVTVTAVSSDSATVEWTTDEPATSVVDYGTAPGSYTDSQQDAALTTSHAVTLTGLAADTTYYVRVTSADAAGNPASSDELGLTTLAAAVPVSDDFSTGTLDPALWTFVNPLSDASVSLTGTAAEIVVPATGTVHDAWTSSNDLPRLRQTVSDVDFEVEAKFESEFTGSGFQSQGILVEESDLDVVRVEFHVYQGTAKLFVASLFGGSASVELSQDVAPLASPMWLRVGRSGDTFTVSWSQDGQTFTPAVSFSQPMVVNGISVYAGNDETTPHTATIDYFFETSAPIAPED